MCRIPISTNIEATRVSDYETFLTSSVMFIRYDWNIYLPNNPVRKGLWTPLAPLSSRWSVVEKNAMLFNGAECWASLVPQA